MHILMLVNYFPPEIGSGPHLPFELGETLVQRGHQVTVVTGFPQYNLQSTPALYRRRVLMRESLGGMNVLRVRSSPYGKGAIVRGLFHLLSPQTIATRALFCDRPDLVYTITPPLALGSAALRTARSFGVPCIVHVQDLFPQNVIDLGLLKNRAIIRFFEKMERKIYRRADAILVMSDSNARHVISRGGRSERVKIAYNWVDTDLVRPAERMNEFRKRHDVGSEFLVLFAGTMGWSQGLEVVIQAAQRLTSVPDLLFLLIGGGVERARLGHLAADLPNVRFLPMQPREEYPEALAASDACLVSLRPEVVTPAVPSKIATIMAAGRPVLGSLPPGDASRFIEESGGGLVVSSGDPEALSAAVLQLKRQPQLAERMGQKGREFALHNFSRNSCVLKIENIMEVSLDKIS